ncbi:MAG TPA: hypothetical protein VHY08_23170 [Bacillota bacterium]|nr:hypothetical protein [Bacillota bacterium]
MKDKDKEATTEPKQSPESSSCKTAESLGGTRLKYRGKTYQEHSLSSSVGRYSRTFYSNRGNK